MRKRQPIDQNKVAANAFLTTGQDVLTVDQVKRYVEIVSKKTNGNTNMFVGGFDIHEFLNRYSFVFSMNINYTDIILLSKMKENGVLKGLFRDDLPKELIKIMKESGKELSLELIEKENKEPSKIYTKIK